MNMNRPKNNIAFSVCDCCGKPVCGDGRMHISTSFDEDFVGRDQWLNSDFEINICSTCAISIMHKIINRIRKIDKLTNKIKSDLGAVIENEMTESFKGEEINVGCKIVSWTDGTDEEIVAMVEAADRGEIDLTDYWSVGQERKVTLSSMPDAGVGESHIEQEVTLVLMNAGGKELANPTVGGRTTCSFIVGQKNGLANGSTGEFGYMNPNDTNFGGWYSCARRTWCNEVYYNAIPSTLRSIFKQHKNITENQIGGILTTSIDFFALPSEKEIFGSTISANPTAEADITQFSYYATSSNRIKKCGDSGSAYYWWERSPHSNNSSYFCSVYSDGSANYGCASFSRLLAPFGCI